VSGEATWPLAGKRALVTGGAKRIGRGIALELARAGAQVAITYRGSAAAAEQTVADLHAVGVGAEAFAVRCDVRSEESVLGAVREVQQRMSGIDLLVNNAGAFETLPLEKISVAAWDAMFETNTRGPFLVAKACHEALKAGRGRIVNIGSLGGIHPWATHAQYCTSKAALHMLSQTMAKAWAPEISVNCVAPGMIVEGDGGAGYEAYSEKTPMQRNGRVEDVAAAVLFFCTAPHFITGQLLAVDGGLGL
jgi:NAD(P)-dependent dehydrogenase (short-subunit alcohol dehydrogenase family)